MVENKTKIISISLPEYTIDVQPDYQSIGEKIDKALEDSFGGQKVAIRALSLADHPKYNLQQLVSVILKTGTDKYDPTRRGVKGFENYDVDFQAGACVIGRDHFGEGADIIQKFYENTLIDRGYRLRVDLLLIYDLDQLKKAEKIDPGKPGVDSRLEQYLFKFKHQKRKHLALVGVVRLL